MGSNNEKKLIIEAIQESGSPVPVKKSKPTKPGVELVGKVKGVKTIRYDQIRKSGWDIKSSLSDWTNRDFALYIRESYTKKYAEDWGLNIVGVVHYINHIKDALAEVVGFCDNIVLLDYIDYYFDGWSDHFMRDHEFTVHPFKFDMPIKDFSEKYDYEKRLATMDDAPVKEAISGRDIENSHLLGEEAFLMSSGLVLSVNWLICEKGIDQEDAVLYVTNIFAGIQNDERVDVILKATQQYSPYPSQFPFRQVGSIINNTSHQIPSEWLDSIQFSESSKFKF